MRTITFALVALLLAGAPGLPAAEPPVSAPKSGDTTPARMTIPGLNLELIRVPPGSFIMGAATDDRNPRPDRFPLRVTITRAYWLGSLPVTQEQWRAVMGGNPSHFTGEANLPVENVSWNDALEFCKKLTDTERKSGRLPENSRYALPTEAQWECACRAGTTGPHYGDLDVIAWNQHNAGNRTHPVGQKPANAWGFRDMLGNVWEWCGDRYAPYPEKSDTDPAGSPEGKDRVFRGGCWNHADPFCTADFRHHRPPEHKYWDLGFRVALVTDAPAK